MRRPVTLTRFGSIPARGGLGARLARSQWRRSLPAASLFVFLAGASSCASSSPPVAAGGAESDGASPAARGKGSTERAAAASRGVGRTDPSGRADGGPRNAGSTPSADGPVDAGAVDTGVSVGAAPSAAGASRAGAASSLAASERLADRPSPAWCRGDLPDAEMLRDNIASTPLSGIAEIVAASITALNGTTPAPTTGYVNLRYEVRVLRWLSGSGPDTLVLHQGAEAGATPARPGRLLVFSACTSKTAIGGAYEPDVGYFFHVDPECLAAVETHAEAAAKRARLSSKPKGRACTP